MRELGQAAEKIFRTSGLAAYEKDAREIYALTRETWEQALSEVLLNDVVEPYRTAIETKRASKLHDSKEDYVGLEDGIAKCSRWMRGHVQPAADGTPYPEPAHLKKCIQDLDDWVQGIRKRRS